MQTCPAGHDLQAEEIPTEYLEKGYYGPWDGTPRYYSKIIGVELPWIYDGIAYWQCPIDGERWHRFPEGDPRREKVEAWWTSPGIPTSTSR
jgi:hypothetical protein